MWIDCHCHTKHSYDNWLEPLALIRRAKALGLDGVVITEHYSYEASASVEAIGRDEGFLIMRGVEIATDRGHLLAYGVEDDAWNLWGRDTWLPIQPVIERVNELGGICVPAHPYREIGVGSLLGGVFDLVGITAVETHNGGNQEKDNALALTATRHLALPGLGGSDCHKVEAVGRCATHFDQPVTNIKNFIAAVRAGACQGNYYPAYVGQQ